MSLDKSDTFAKVVAYIAIIVGLARFLDYFDYINYCTFCHENSDYGLAMAIQALGGGLLVLLLLKLWFPKGDLRIKDD